jgi:hypothetical protein
MPHRKGERCGRLIRFARRGEDHCFKQDGKDVDVSDQNRIIYGTGIGDDQPHRSKSQAFQSFPFALKIFQGIFLIDVVSLQEAVNLIAGFKAEQAP